MDTRVEEWRHSPLAPPHVEVSSLGQVRTQTRTAQGIREGRINLQTRTGTVMSPWVGRHGYLMVAVKIGPARPKFLVHRLVAAAFCDGFSPDLCVNHINGLKHDNRASNLEWVTLAKNTELQWRDGLVDLRGEKQPGSKLTIGQVRNIRRALTDGTKAAVLAQAYGVSAATIYKIAKGTRWAASV